MGREGGGGGERVREREILIELGNCTRETKKKRNKRVGRGTRGLGGGGGKRFS